MNTMKSMKRRLSRISILGLLVLLNITSLNAQGVLKVPGHFPTIQAAINNARSGQTVLVSPGIYYELLDFQGKDITVKSQQGPRVTIIDANFSGNVVTFVNIVSRQAILEGFTLRHGAAHEGGGIQCDNNASPTIRNNVITGNSANGGGGISCLGGSQPLITGNQITANSAGHTGGGIRVHKAGPTIENNLIAYNINIQGPGPLHGGGIWIGECSAPVRVRDNRLTGNRASCGGGIFSWFSSRLVLDGNTFIGNYATDCGGGLRCESGDEIIVNNLFTMNWASSSGGGGISCYGAQSAPTASVWIVNNTLYNNGASYGGGITGSGNALVVVANTILWNNTAALGSEIASVEAASVSFSHGDIMGGVEVGSKSVHKDSGAKFSASNWINLNPAFVNPLANDFHIQSSSPCRDGGDNTVSQLPGTDFEGDLRLTAINGRVDIGADEFSTHLYWSGVARPGGPVSVRMTGDPGAAAVLGVAAGTLPQPLPLSGFDPSFRNMWLLPPISLFLLGTIKKSGELFIQMPYSLPPGTYSLHLQAATLSSSNKLSNLEVVRVAP